MFNFLRNAPRACLPSVTDIAAGVARREIALVDVREMAEVQASGMARGAHRSFRCRSWALKCGPEAPDCMTAAGQAGGALLRLGRTVRRWRRKCCSDGL